LATVFESEQRTSIDFVVYIAVTLFAIAFFLLATYETPIWGNSVVFATMIGLSFAIILGIKHYASSIGEGPMGAVADFDRPLTPFGLLLSVVLGVLVVAAMGVASRQSVLYVPMPQIQLPFSISPFDVNKMADMLYQFTLVAPAEEGMKVAGIYALYLRWREFAWAPAPAVAVPIMLWAAFHTILAGFNLYLVFFAFLAGIIFYIGMKVTGSILAPIISHSVYNTIIIMKPMLVAVFGG